MQPGSPLETLVARAAAIFAGREKLKRFAAEPWFIDAVDTSAGGLAVRGWAFVDEVRSDRDYSSRFSFNGRPFDRVLYPVERNDVAACFPARAGAKDCGFALFANDASNLYPAGVLEITCRDSATPGDARARDSWFIPDSSLHAVLPDEDQRFRVIGNRDAFGFLMSGCTDYHRLDGAGIAATGKPMHEHRAILDWGCGCGRIARHLAPRSSSFFGCDIDAGNVGWCAEHLPGRYHLSSLRPPLPYGDAAFDLIYGVSVFTHFRPVLEALWLVELRRIAAPGALLLMTVHGQTTIDYGRLDPRRREALLRDVERRGILCAGRNDQLDGHVAHEDEYVNVYHSQKYIRRVWGAHFDVVDILPGYVFTHDLVILRRR